MVSVVILGSGNVAQHLIRAFGKSTLVNLVQVYSRNPLTLQNLLPSDKIISDVGQITQADLYIVSVLDDAIAQVCESLEFSGRLVVHTSGTKPIDVIPSRFKRGVFYPLQTFSKTREIDYGAIPFCLETEHPEDFRLLETVAGAISPHIYRMDSAQRKALHAAAVFVSNFTNHLYAIGNKICSENNIPFDVLKPLILETARKVMTLSPVEAQTGPAIRHDQGTIDAHLAFLGPEYRDLYEKLTHSIQNEQKL